MKIRFFGNTDKGRLRKGNEDFFAHDKLAENDYLFVVADGMGGHQAGQVASKVGTLTFVQQYAQLRAQESIPDALNKSMYEANAAILAKATSDLDKRGMGTTFSALAIKDMQGCIAHVGDSRVYLVRNNAISRLTTDHTFVEKMVEEGKLSDEEAREHPQRNILYMSLGARQSFDPEFTEMFKVNEGDIYVLCSDGLNNMVKDEDIKEYAMSYPPKDAVDKLIALANQNGGTDNITVQVVQLEDSLSTTKTEPIKIIKKRSKLASFFSLFKQEAK